MSGNTDGWKVDEGMDERDTRDEYNGRDKREGADKRIAPLTAASAGGPSVSEGPSSRRLPVKTLCAGIVVVAMTLFVAVVGIGSAAVWFEQTEGSATPSQEEIQAAPSQGKNSPDSKTSSIDPASPSVEAEKATDQSIVMQPAAESSTCDDASDAAEVPATSESSLVSKPISEPDPVPNPALESASEQPSVITVLVHIDSSRASSEGWPSCMASTSVKLNQGASVYDALCATGVTVGGSSGYVGSINGLAEFSCGSGSGWLYFVNGSSPGYGCSSFFLHGGESITWVYTLDGGNDL